MTYLDRALHGLDWLFSKPAPDIAQLFVAFALIGAGAALATLIIEGVRIWREYRAKR